MKTDKELAKEYGMSPSYFSKGYKWFRKLKGNSKEISKKVSSQKPHIPMSHLKLRLHRYQRSYLIQNAISEEKLRSLKLNDKLMNNKQWLGSGFRITSQHLELEGLELISDSRLPVAILEALALSTADNIAKGLASTYGLVIALTGETPPKLTEIELNAIQLTEKMEHRGLIQIYTDADGYKVWVDWSFGVGGLESNKALYIQKLTDFANDLVVKDMWEVLKARQELGDKLQTQLIDTVDSLAKSQAQQASQDAEFRKTFVEHETAYKEVAETNRTTQQTMLEALQLIQVQKLAIEQLLASKPEQAKRAGWLQKLRNLFKRGA